MVVKLAFLVTFVLSVSTFEQTLQKVCEYNHHTAQAVCSNFRLTSSKDFNFDKLTLDNVTASLNFHEVPPVSNLTYLSISNSHIDSITFDIFPNLVFLVLLNNKNFPKLSRTAFGPNNARLNWLSLIGNNHTLESDSLHFLKNLTWLHIQNQKFEHLTGEFLKEATKLHELTVRNCQLKTIDADAFDNTQEIEILSLNFNRIKYFEGGTFKHLKKLKILELHHNKFTSFDHEQFRGLHNLEILGLPSSFLKNVKNSQELLETFPKLEKMEVKKSDLTRSDIGPLIRELRQKKILIIGTPHDCYSSPSCSH